MQAELRMAVLAMIATGSVCALALGQAGPGTELASRIHAGESTVRSRPGQTDGVAWLRLAVLYQDAADYDDAERAFRRAIKLLKPVDRKQYADALDRTAVMYVERGKYAQAQKLEQKALAIRESEHDTTGVGRSLMHLSLVAYGRNDLGGAESDAEMAVSLLAPEGAAPTGPGGATPEERMSALIDLGLIRCAQGSCDRATHPLARALQLAKADYERNSVPVGFVNFLLGYTRAKSGDLEGGAELMKSGIEEMKTQLGWGHPTYVAALKEYRATLIQAGRKDDAGRIEVSIAELERSCGAAHSTDRSGFLGINRLR